MVKLYKYRNFSDSYMENIIKNSALYFSSVEQFNDPFDCKLSFRQNYSNQEISDALLGVKERNPDKFFRLKDMKKKFGKNEDFIELQNNTTKEILASLGVLSLSKNYNNILMWSHYSESHTGLVFKFNPKNTNNENSCFYHPIKVDYSESYDELSYVNNHQEEIPKLLLTKYKDWAYEEEYRCFGLDFQGEKKFEKDELTGIIFGAKASQANIKRMIDLCQEYDFSHVKFKQAKLRQGSFSLDFEDIDI